MLAASTPRGPEQDSGSSYMCAHASQRSPRAREAVAREECLPPRPSTVRAPLRRGGCCCLCMITGLAPPPCPRFAASVAVFYTRFHPAARAQVTDDLQDAAHSLRFGTARAVMRSDAGAEAGLRGRGRPLDAGRRPRRRPRRERLAYVRLQLTLLTLVGHVAAEPSFHCFCTPTVSPCTAANAQTRVAAGHSTHRRPRGARPAELRRAEAPLSRPAARHLPTLTAPC